MHYLTIRQTKQPIILILTHLPWEWSSDYVNQTALELSKHSVVVCFDWPGALSIREIIRTGAWSTMVRTPAPRLLFLRGVHVLPFRRFRRVTDWNMRFSAYFLRVILRILCIRYATGKRIVWFFDPGLFRFAHLIRNAVTVYDCVDYWRRDPSLAPKQRDNIATQEQESVTGASVMTVNSNALYALHKGQRADLVLVPQGFRLESFRRLRAHPFPLHLRRSVVGYVGAMNDRVDFRLLLSLVRSCRRFTFVCVASTAGTLSIQNQKYMKALRLLPNFVYLENVRKEYIPDIIRQFTIGIIPYRDDGFNMFSFPMKLLEYFYLGKPVISSRIRELEQFKPYVTFATSLSDWKKSLSRLSSGIWPGSYRQAQKRIAVTHSWERKVRAVLSRIYAADQ